MKPPTPSTPQSRDIFGAEFSGTPSHHRVLKPPGGGSSDIFGTNSAQETNVRRVKNHLASSVFLSDEPSPAMVQSSAMMMNSGNGASAAATTMTPAKHQSEHINGDNTDGGYNGEQQPMVNGNSQPVMNGNRNGNNGAAASRTRVPPGGFSSGLW